MADGKMKTSIVATSKIELGARGIHSHLSANGCRSDLVLLDSPDGSRYSDKTMDSLARITQDSDLVGVSGTSLTREKTQQVLDYHRSRGKVVVVGGYDATLSPDSYVNSSDYVCKGDGEGVMLDIVRSMEAGEPLGKGVLPIQPVIKLDDLSADDYDFENQFVLDESGLVVPATKLQSYRNPRGKDQKNPVFYVASRGCPSACSFCSESKYMKESGVKGVRVKSPRKVIQDLMNIRKQRPEMASVYFVDPDFLERSLGWIKKFSGDYAKEINLPFYVFASAQTVSERKLKELSEAGLEWIQIGIQSGSRRTREEVYNKKVSNDKIKEAIKIAGNYVRSPWIDLIFDNPYEQKDDLLETINLVRELPVPFMLGCFGLHLIPGTPLEKKARADGFVDPNRETRLNLHLRTSLLSKQTYLNTMIRMMAGECNDSQVGRIPRSSLDTLVNPSVIKFMEENPLFAKSLDPLLLSDGQIALMKGGK